MIVQVTCTLKSSMFAILIPNFFDLYNNFTKCQDSLYLWSLTALDSVTDGDQIKTLFIKYFRDGIPGMALESRDGKGHWALFPFRSRDKNPIPVPGQIFLSRSNPRAYETSRHVQ